MKPTVTALRTWALAAVLPAVIGVPVPSQAAATPPETYLTRLQALAMLETLNAELLSDDSATATLERWCTAHHLASPAVIVAERVATADRAPTPAQRRDLAVTAAELVRYRHVRLRCGTVPLSDAENWYVPGRLTFGMNRLLDTTDLPFGKVVGALRFQRHTLSARLLWQPLPDGWEWGTTAGTDATPPGGSAAALERPAALLEHRAVLSLPDGTPFSEVVETYTSHVLDLPAPGT